MTLSSVAGVEAVNGDFPLPMNVLLEGEEESGSPSAGAFMEGKTPRKLRADYAMICDNRHVFQSKVPSIVTMLRRIEWAKSSHTGPIWTCIPACTAAIDEPARVPVQTVIASLHRRTQVALRAGFSMPACPSCPNDI